MTNAARTPHQGVEVIEDWSGLPERGALLSGQGGPRALLRDYRADLAIFAAPEGAEVDLLFLVAETPKAKKSADIQMQRLEPGTTFSCVRVTKDILAYVYGKEGDVAFEPDSVDNIQRRLAKHIYDESIKRGATDIHITCHEEATRVKVRVHGLLEPLAVSIPDGVSLLRAIYAAGEEPSKDSGWSPRNSCKAAINYVSARGVRYRFRFQSMPIAPGGSKTTMRIFELDSTKATQSFEDLGFDDLCIKSLLRISARPYGLFAVVGSVNSGKSTTLHAMISHQVAQAKGRKEFVSAENPVEKLAPGVHQVDVSTRGEAGFAEAVSDFLRSDVNVIMVGETRGSRTTGQVIRASKTGHFTLTTTHANDVFAGLQQLVRYGANPEELVEPDVLLGLVAQRLVPVLCPACRVPFEKADLSDSVAKRWKELFPHEYQRLRFINSLGCEHCHGRGVIGRTVACAILEPDTNLRSHIAKGEWMLARYYWRSGAGNSHNPLFGRLPTEMITPRVLNGEVDPTHVEEIVDPFDAHLTREEALQAYRELSTSYSYQGRSA